MAVEYEIARAMEPLIVYLQLFLAILLIREVVRLFTGGGASGSTPTVNKWWKWFKRGEEQVSEEEKLITQEEKMLGAIEKLEKRGFRDIKKLIGDLKDIINIIKGGGWFRTHLWKSKQTPKTNPEAKAKLIEKLNKIKVEEKELEMFITTLTSGVRNFDSVLMKERSRIADTQEKMKEHIKEEIKKFKQNAVKNTTKEEYDKLEVKLSEKVEKEINEAALLDMKEIQQVNSIVIPKIQQLIREERNYLKVYSEGVAFLQQERYDDAVGVFQQALKILEEMAEAEKGLVRITNIMERIGKHKFADETAVEKYMKEELKIEKIEEKA